MPDATVSLRLRSARRRVGGLLTTDPTVGRDWRRNTAIDFTNLYEFTGEDCASFPRRRIFAA